MAEGTRENHQGVENSEEHHSKPCLLSHQPASPLPSPRTFVPLSGSISFLLPLSFKPTPYSGSESQVGQPPMGHLEMWDDVLVASVHEGAHFCRSLGSS